jgi:nitroreductase
MDVLDTLKTRKSVRAFRDEPLGRELVEKVLAHASMAPSAINLQPWEVHVVMGEERKRLSGQLLRSYRERKVTCSPGAVKPIPGQFIERGRQCAEAMGPLLERMGVDFSTYVNEGSLEFYSAPAVVLVFMDEAFPPERSIDAGVFLAYLVLAAAGHGLATCPIGLVTAYADDVKEHLNIPESKRMIIAVALGYPDEKAPINEFRSPRIELKDFVRWID